MKRNGRRAYSDVIPRVSTYRRGFSALVFAMGLRADVDAGTVVFALRMGVAFVERVVFVERAAELVGVTGAAVAGGSARQAHQPQP